MASSNDLVTVPRSGLPIAHMRNVYRVGDVERRLDKLPPKEHEGLRSTYERMLEKGPSASRSSPRGCPRWTICTTTCPTSPRCSTT